MVCPACLAAPLAIGGLGISIFNGTLLGLLITILSLGIYLHYKEYKKCSKCV